MFCAQCHSPNADDNKFCSECGDRLTGSLSAGENPEIVQLISQAFTFLEQGDLPQAHSAIEAALILSPESSTAHSVRGILYEREGKIAEAIRELELVVAKNPHSTTDRAKLEALRGNVTSRVARRRWTSQQITFVSAAAAGLVVFGVGLAVINQSPASHHDGIRSQSAGLQPASSTLPVSASASPASPRPLRPLPTTPAPAAGLQGPPVPSPIRAALGKAPAPVFTAPGRQALLRPSAPIGPMGVPQVGAGGPAGGAGLPPAAIGEVVPLPQTPAVAPGGPPSSPVAAAPSAVPGGAPVPGATGLVAVPAPEASQPVEPITPRAKVEPLEPETGFIRIEPLKGTGESKGTGPAAAKSAAPSISVNIASSGGDEAAIAEAQRAQKNAFNAARLANLEDAERQYRQAASLYELLVKRGGSSARQAREGLDACRKALAALR